MPQLFGAFFRLGLTAFGGPAVIPYLRTVAVEKHRWLSREAFGEGVALCQTIPGATAMQTAAWIGLRARGVSGAACCYAGFGLPAFLLMWGLSFAYERAHALPVAVSVFSGLQAVIVAVTANAGVMFFNSSVKNGKDGFIVLFAAGLFGISANPLLILAAAALFGSLLNGRTAETERDACPEPVRNVVVPLFVLLGVAALVAGMLYGLREDLFRLAALMAKVDLMAFGGGYASVPLMFHEVVEVRSWMNAATFMDGIALGQFTPGPIVITATFAGYLTQGFPGACVATAAVFFPSFFILIAAAPLCDRMRALAYFDSAVRGVCCSLAGLLLIVTLRFAAQVHRDSPHVLLAAAALAALRFKIDILWVVLGGAAVSAALF